SGHVSTHIALNRSHFLIAVHAAVRGWPSARSPQPIMTISSTLDHVVDTHTALPSLEELWMPFTANRAFKRAPRMLVAAKDMHYTSDDGRRVLDGTAGLWCVNAGHCREPIVRAIAESAATLDFAPGFQMGHPLAFQLAERLTR